MNNVHPLIAQALSPFAPASSSVHTDAELTEADRICEYWKDTHNQRHERRALELQINRPQTVEGWFL